MIKSLLLLCFTMILFFIHVIDDDFLHFIFVCAAAHMQKLINYFDRFNYNFAKWNRKWFICRRKRRMTSYTQVMMDSFGFILFFCHFTFFAMHAMYELWSISLKDSIKARPRQRVPWAMFHYHSWNIRIYGDSLTDTQHCKAFLLLHIFFGLWNLNESENLQKQAKRSAFEGK